jgi:arylsulfatase A-like enzyme
VSTRGRRAWLVLAGSLAVGHQPVACTWTTEAPAPPQPSPAIERDTTLPIDAAHTDVLLLNLCTVRRDRLGLYGHERPTSPFLDALGAGGVTFETNFAQAPWTRPSMGALLTGHWPRALHLDDRGPDNQTSNTLADTHITLAERLHSHAYRTAGVFGNPHLRREFGFAQGFDAYRTRDGKGWAKRPPEAARIVKDSLALAARVPADRRLYLQVNMLDAHLPIRTRDAFVPRMDVGPEATRRPDYDSALRAMDKQLRVLVQGLRETRPNLLVVVATDHGEGLRLPGHHGPEHGNHVYRSTVETALVYWHPALLEPGRRAGGLSMNLDVVPTLLDLLGLPPDENLDGHSQAQAVRGEAPNADHDVVFSETFFRATHKATAFDGTWQLVRTHDDAAGTATDALFSAADPDAMTDAAGAQPAATARLAERLDAWEAEMRRLEGQGVAETRPLDEQQLEMLEQLGYLGGDDD